MEQVYVDKNSDLQTTYKLTFSENVNSCKLIFSIEIYKIEQNLAVTFYSDFQQFPEEQLSRGGNVKLQHIKVFEKVG